MKVTSVTKRALATRREERQMKAAGYKKHETDWQIHRGADIGKVITDAKVSVCGRYVYTKIGNPEQEVKA